MEEGRLVELVPGLGQGEVVEASDVARGPGVARGLCVVHGPEVTGPAGESGAVGGAEEEFRAVGGGHRVEGRVLGGTAARQHRCEEGLGAAGGAGRVR
nr:hypothetical protein [Streptomyces sp. LBUM 1483]